MAGTVVADTLQAASASTLVLKNGVASTPPTVQDSAGTQIGTFCRAWANFNGTTVTSPASMTGVNASFNVSSILDNGTGDYTINFTTAMPNANYAVSGSCLPSASRTCILMVNDLASPTTTALRVFSAYSDATLNRVAFDSERISIAIFG